MTPLFDRRGVLKALSAAGAALALPEWAQRRAVAAAGGAAGRVLRVAHITDVHVQPELRAGEGFSQCLTQIGGLSGEEKPDVVFNTGDAIMDSMDQDEARTKLQWELWQKCLKDGPGLPIEHCIGNHDIWGVNKAKSKTKGDEAKYGKKWACEVFGLERPYRRFDRAGWSFLVLDSVMPKEGSYEGRLDPEQMDWFKGELKAIPATTPIMVLSHIPILTVTPFGDESKNSDKSWSIPISRMMADWVEFRNLFRKHKNVKCCISGHLHQLDLIEFEGVTYMCNGAVSGAWWKGKRNETDCGFALLDLYADGRVERRYVETGWKPAKGE
ncbi:MAG: metallophosphoesterase family protein [Phycisphaerales bacterium]